MALAERESSGKSKGNSRGSHAGADQDVSASKKHGLAQHGLSPHGLLQHRLFHRTGIVLPAAGLALLLVVAVWGGVNVMDPSGTGAANLFAPVDGMRNSESVAAMTAEYITIQKMKSASQALAVVAVPAHADPDEIMANTEAASESGGVDITTLATPNNPTQDEQDAMNLLPTYGFSVSSQWGCLYNLWNRESGWNVYAENPYSGAYGIPQALPGSKMATAGSDWQSNPITQIKWGLGYIQQTYGTPCGAWDNEEEYGSY